MTNIDKANTNTNTIDAEDKRARKLAAEIERNNFQALDNISQDLKIDKLVSYEDLKKKQELIYEEGSLTSEQLRYVNAKLVKCVNMRDISDMTVSFDTELGRFSPAQIKVLYWLLKDLGFPCEKTEYQYGKDKVSTVEVNLRDLILFSVGVKY